MKPIRYLIIFLMLVPLACKKQVNKVPVFVHDIAQGPKPWTGETFKEGGDDFTFAIISDLNGGERQGVFNVAVAQINRLEPTFVLSIGDLIDGGTEDMATLAKEWDSFDKRASNFEMPFFHLGGNHDLTNPVMRTFWKQRFGPRYYYFVYKEVLFLMIDSEDFEEKRMNEIYHARAKALKVLYGETEGAYEDTDYYKMPERKTGAMSNAQFDYFKQVLEKYRQVRWTFVLMHKPIWAGTDSTKNLARLENVLKDRNYTVINGHVHSFSHRLKSGHDYIILGTTGGSQNPKDPKAFDHVTFVRMASKPVITHFRMDGILDETGHIPLGGDTLSFQASKKLRR